MATTIQIAPYDHEIKVEGDVVSTEFAGGIKYTAKGLSQYRVEDIKKCFSTAIAMASKRWQLEMMLNECFELNGKIE